VATQLSGFADYQINEAWTWEHLALTRARVITGAADLKRRVEAEIRTVLVRPRDRAKVAADVLDMRKRIEAEKGTDNVWDLKQVRGGLVDLEFIAQYLQLIHASEHPDVLDQNTVAAYQKLMRAGLLDVAAAEKLIDAARLIHGLTQILRLCIEEAFDPATAPSGLKELLARAGDAPGFAALEARLKAALAEVAALFSRLVA
jgi:glutamate-ammonia-ligase adenylyltransferase